MSTMGIMLVLGGACSVLAAFEAGREVHAKRWWYAAAFVACSLLLMFPVVYYIGWLS